MRIGSILALYLLLLAATGISAAPPNIVVFVSDDHRADQLGSAGHPFLQTPSIDRLAAEGVRFRHAYVTTSICAASRASILTGMVERTHRYTFGTPPLSQRWCRASYPARLRVAGYRTGFVGKFGVSVEGGQSTIAAMFDSFVPLSRSPYVKARSDGSTRHVTDLTGDAAIQFIRSSPADAPFCLSVSFNAAHAEDADKENHYPYAASEEGLYADIPMPRPVLDDPSVFEALPDYLKQSMNRDRYFWRWDTPDEYNQNLRNYLRMLTGMDRNIGRVLDELELRGVLDDTLIIFLGDNGYYMGERGLAGKWSHFDESLRIPMVIRDPRMPADLRGRVLEQIALNIDIAPTVLAAAGLPAGSADQGMSLLPLLRRSGARWTRDGFYCEHRMVHVRIPRWEGVRSAEFMYANYLDAAERSEWLHDLRSDPKQLVNRVDDPAVQPALNDIRTQTLDASARYARRGSDLPRILLLGDSISMGYHNFVVQSLDPDAIVMRPRENCAGTTRGLQRIDDWLTLDGGDFDIIHFNFGLHDLKRIKPDGSNSDDPQDARQAEPDAYEAHLRAIVDRLQHSGSHLVFATTTPVPSGGVRPHRDPEDVIRYNNIARSIMAEHSIPINDLYAFALPRLAEIQRPVNVHFTADGSALLATQVVEHLQTAIQRSRPDR